MLSPPVEVPGPQLELRQVGQLGDVSTIAEIHRTLGTLTIGRPVGQKVTIRVARLDEVHPILMNNLGHGCIRRTLRATPTTAKLLTKCKRHLECMCRKHLACGLLIPAERIELQLVEKVHIDLALPLLRLHVGPSVSWPSESCLAEDVGMCIKRLLVVCARIHPLELIAPLGSKRDAHLFFILCRCETSHEAREHRSFVRICSHQHIHVVEVTLLVLNVGIGAKYIVVVTWPQGSTCTECCRIVQENLSRQLAKVLQFGVLLARDALDVGQTIGFRAFHIAYTVVVKAYIVHRNHVATALADSTAEEALGQRALAKHTHRNGTCALAHDGHLGWVATEGCDVVMHPLQRHDLIHDAIVA